MSFFFLKKNVKFCHCQIKFLYSLYKTFTVSLLNAVYTLTIIQRISKIDKLKQTNRPIGIQNGSFPTAKPKIWGHISPLTKPTKILHQDKIQLLYGTKQVNTATQILKLCLVPLFINSTQYLHQKGEVCGYVYHIHLSTQCRHALSPTPTSCQVAQ